MVLWFTRAGLPAESASRPASGVAGVILAAGRGRRLRPVTDDLAKPLVPVLNVPLLYWAAAALRTAGVEGLVVNVHVRGDQFEAAATALRDRHGVNLTLVREDRLSGPAGGLAGCREALPDAECSVVVSGDAFTDLDLAAVVLAHRGSAADLTIVATRVPDPHRFGVLRLRGTNVVGLDEKPPSASPDALVSCGIYVIQATALCLLDPSSHDAYDFKHVVPMLLAAGMSVHVYPTDTYWADVGTVDSLRATNLWALASVAVARVARPRAVDAGTVWEQGPSHLGLGVRVQRRALIGADAVVGARAVLDNSVIGPAAQVGAGAIVSESVVMPGAVVPAGAVVDNEVVL
ncbi:MAG: sugar phosphate nucleotidyltransferase [Pseudonocardiaceae bacterium]